MGLRDIFRASQNVIESIQKIVTDNQEINKKLETAGGFISLIGIVIDIYSDIKDRLKTPEERAFGSLIRVTFQSTEELLNELKMKLPRDIQSKIDEKINKKEMIKRLLDPFLIHSDWDSYLPDHPAISGFKYEILSILKDSGCNYDLLNSFIMKFNINLESNIDKDENIHIFYDWWTKENKYKRLKEYLEFVKSHRYYVMGLDNRPLFEYYIEQNALSTSVYTWTYSNKEFDSDNAGKVRQILYNFLDKDKKWYLIIGASFGIGKSSMVRMIASEYATAYLNSDQDNASYKNNTFIPILVFLKDGLDVVYYQDNLDYLLNEIICPDEPSQKRKILLMLDGLDEYPYQNDIANLMTRLKELRNKYSNLKVIITTRLESGLPEELKINDSENEYIRLLPFTVNQVDNFFEKYITYSQYESFFQKYGQEKITYDFVQKELGFQSKNNGINEEITKPLFAWMLSLILVYPQINIDFKKEWSNKMKKSLLYLFFIHHIIKGKYNIDDKPYFFEKKALRKVSALIKIYGSDLTLDLIKNYLNNDNLKVESYEINRILSSYLYFDKTNNDFSIGFIHETFKEYLIAEFYLECLLEGKYYKLNIGTPSKDTIDFLHGLIELLMVDDKDIIEKHIDSNKDKQITLLNSFKYDNELKIAKNQIISSTLNSINNENIVFLNVDTKIKDMVWRESEINIDNYNNLWIHRWLSLYILNIFALDNFSKKINKQKLINLIKNSSINVPSYLKSLRNLNLVDSNLVDSNLSYADLTNANLAGANLFNANLSYAHLTNANLAGANLFNANISNANLTRANLAGSYLSMANLSSANLSHANLSRAIINDANLLETNLSHANLSRAIINDANLFSANLSSAILSHANLSHARLAYAYLLNCKEYSDMICEDTDLSNSIIDSKDIEFYFKNRNAMNVPEAITDRESLKTILKYRNIDEITIEKILDLY
jgi:uncharacterized protein YjbI with pentapeptide repeats